VMRTTNHDKSDHLRNPLPSPLQLSSKQALIPRLTVCVVLSFGEVKISTANMSITKLTRDIKLTSDGLDSAASLQEKQQLLAALQKVRWTKCRDLKLGSGKWSSG
jgi:hypothetical protein